MPYKPLPLLLATVWTALGNAEVRAQESLPVSYYNQVRPLLVEHCQGCHQRAKPQGGYVVTEFAELLRGGESGKSAVVAGRPEASYLLDQVALVDGRAAMPKERPPLPPKAVSLLRDWIAQGAHDDTPDAVRRLGDSSPPTVYPQAPVLTAIDFSPDGSVLAVSGYHEVLLHRPDGGLLARLVGQAERVQALAFSPNGKWLAVAGGSPARFGELQIWDVARRRLRLSVTVTFDTLYGLSWSPDGTTVAFGCPDNTVRAVDALTGKQVLQQGAHADWVLGTAFSTDGIYLVSVSRDRSMKLTEVATQRFIDDITSITPGALKGGLMSVARHPAREEILVGGADGVPRIYRMHRTKKRVIGDDHNLVQSFEALPGRLFAVRYSRDGALVAAGASANGTGEARVYRAQTGGLLARLAGQHGPVYALAFRPDGRQIASAGSDGIVRLNDTRTGELVRLFVPVPVAPDTVAATPAEARNVSFVRDIMPALSRMGCNAGTCHGSQAGKNGFKLSLRGYDPQFDHRALVDDLSGRRFDRASPARSLMLLKPSGGVPHTGGVLTRPGERYYELIRAWIAQGAPYDAGSPRVAGIALTPASVNLALPGAKQRLSVRARYTDGSERDVSNEAFLETSSAEVAMVDRSGAVTAVRRGEATIMARYEGAYAASPVVVMGNRAGFVWQAEPEHNFVDTLVNEKLRRVKVLPSRPCTDAEFVRRVYLDLTGLPPTAEDVRRFVDDARASQAKRDALVDRLLGSAEYVEHWTNKWADLLLVNRRRLGPEGAQALRAWIRRAVAGNMPYDRFVYSILTASGSTLENPPAAYYKTLREPGPAMENTTQLFLAIRFNCNKCHDHPFERWTQDQYYQLAAYFAQVSRTEDPKHKGQKLEGSEVEAALPLVEVIGESGQGEVRHERTGAIVPPTLPFRHAGMHQPKGSRREQLARWLVAPENPYFARSYVNRLWSYLLGVGLIEPVDDIRAGNPATNPQLLDRLTAEFVQSGFNARHMLSLICKSRAYQRSVETNAWNKDDDLNYAHALARRLPAEVLYDAIQRATGSTARLPQLPPGARAAQLLDSTEDAPGGFFSLFGKPPRESACECERSSSMLLGPVLNLVNGPVLGEAVRDPSNQIARLVAQERSDARVVDALFWSILNRGPTAAEAANALTLFRGREAEHTALATEYRRRTEALRIHENQMPRQQRAWERDIVSGPAWTIAQALQLEAVGQARLAQRPDGAISARGKNADFETYRVQVKPLPTAITGFRVEALAHNWLPKHGPGRSNNGNFVLTEFRVLVRASDGSEQPAVVARAAADFSQEGYAVQNAIDGQSDTGWAINPEAGQDHVAVFALEKPLCLPAGAKLVLALEQRFPGKKHNLGRFRLALTSDRDPLRQPILAPALAKAIHMPPRERTAEQAQRIAAYFRSLDSQLAALTQSLAEFPPPPADRRLLAAQDIAWALLNSPAFQFNH